MSTNPSEIELRTMRPCPFPGCDGGVIDLVATEVGGFYQGQCLECGFSTPSVGSWDADHSARARNAAIRRWNRVVRVLDPALKRAKTDEIKPGIPQKEDENLRLEGYHRRVEDGVYDSKVETIEMVVSAKTADLYADAIHLSKEKEWIHFAGRFWRVKPLGPPLVHFYHHSPKYSPPE